MSTKDLFDKGHSLNFLKNKSLTDYREDVESPRYIDAYVKRKNRFFPDVDYATASNFAVYGLAEEYYKSSIERIYKTYPYDGSLAEKLEWENNSTYLDLHIFENEYPRSNGYVNVNNTYTSTVQSNLYSSSAPQYIIFKGNPHADVSGNYKQPAAAGPSGVGVSKANVYETGSYKTDNLEADPTKGITIEFWMKKDGWGPDDSIEYVFDVSSSGSSGDTYGNLGVYVLKSAPTFLAFNFISGSSNSNASVTTGITAGPEGGLADSKWHHYAITLKRQNDQNIINFYVDGIHKSQETDNTPASAIEGKLIASIGARSGPLKNGNADLGWGGLVSASIDEFRYWKAERNAQQIGRHFRDQIGGGTNTDNVKYDKTHNPVDLGVYFKFNEGITGDDTIDNTVLDYSGRVSNGTFVNYQSASSRNTGSAMISAGVAEKEFKDPIIYLSHPSVLSLLESKRIEGTVHDHENATSIYKSIPGWIAEEDEEKSSNLKYLVQIMSSVFDEMQLQIGSLPKLKDINYPYDAKFEKPLPFADRLLSSRGLDAPELFSDASLLAKFLQRGENKLFEKKLYEVKNTIYQNIYNNLTYIHKSKGTMKSMRNLLRCFGVDEELVKINIYAKNGTYEFKDNVSHMALRKKYADFDDLETRFGTTGIYSGTFAATVYQYYDSTNSNSLSYIPGLPDVSHGLAATIEAEVIFPKRTPEKDNNFGLFPGREVSLFGIHAVEESNTNLNWLNDTINFNVIARKSLIDPRSVKFALVTDSTSNIPEMETTGTYMGAYDNEKWNLAFRIRPVKHPLADKVDGTMLPAASTYQVELYGVNYLSDQLQNEFTITEVLSEANARAFFTKAKRLFVGAHRTNFDGDLIRASDVKISSVNVWYDYLNDDEIKAHARDANNIGRMHPYRNAIFNEGSQNDLIAGGDTDTLWTVRVPEIDTLVLSWNFENVTGSDSNGQFLVNDISSGSAADRASLRYGPLSNVNTYHMAARGDKFVATSSQAVDLEFVPTGRSKTPEVISSDDMVKILNQQDDVMFTRDTTYIQHIISVEKSMYQSISEEMLRMFSTVTDFSNIVGSPVNRYRMNYKELTKLRSIFFEIVENEPDIEKYIEYFKWIDDAISLFIFQLLPASSNKVEYLRNMVESHILERSKHFNKFPTIEMFNPVPNEALKGVNELLYNWKFGHAPLQSNNTAPAQNQNQHMNSLWWKQRAERTGSGAVLTSNNDDIDANKHEILKAAITETSGNDNLALSHGPTGLDKADGKYGAQGGTKTKYSASYYADRSTSTLVRISQDFVKTYKSGPNPDSHKIYDFYKGVIRFASDNDYIFLDKDHVLKPIDSTDVLKAESSSSAEGLYLPNKEEYKIKAFAMTGEENLDSNSDGTGVSDYEYTDALNKLVNPFNMFANKGVANGDYTAFYEGYFESGHHSSQNDTTRIEINNAHHDVYRPTYEVPMQGPFNHQHVGGNQHRHVGLNYSSYKTDGSSTSLDSRMTRPEAWELVHDKNMTNYIILDMPFSEHNMPPEMSGSDPTTGHVDTGHRSSDPEPKDRWKSAQHNKVFPSSPGMSLAIESENGWQRATTITSPTCGPNQDSGDGTGFFAYARIENNKNNEHKFFGYRTPLIDAHDAQRDMIMQFYYHVTSPADLETGGFSVSYSYDEDFNDAGTSLNTLWDKGAAGQTTAVMLPKTLEQTSKNDAWKLAEVDLAIFMGKRVYIRFNYLAAPHSHNVCAIDQVKVTAAAGISSLRVLHPTHDDHNRPYAIQMREEYAKRPVNIKNIQVGSLIDSGSISALHAGDFGALQRTIAGNYRNTYEYISTVSRESNDKAFKEWAEFNLNGSAPYLAPSETKQEIASMFLSYSNQFGTPWTDPKTQHGTEGRLARYRAVDAVASGITSSSEVEDSNVTPVPGRNRRNTHKEFQSEYRQKTRMVNLFSSPGDIMDSCVGFLDEPHRTYSAYNALPWRNYRIRQRMQSMLTAHCGRFGIGTHTQDAAASTGGIKIVDNAALSTIAETDSVILTMTDGHGRTINMPLLPSDAGLIPTSFSDSYEVLNYPMKISSTSALTANSIVTAFSSAKTFFKDGSGAIAGSGVEFSINATIDASDSTKVNFSQSIAGFASNTKIYIRYQDPDNAGNKIDVPSSTVQIETFRGGKNATARVYRSQAVQPPQAGVIEKADYTVVSASFHKYHRNRADKFFLSDATQENMYYEKMQELTSSLSHTNVPTDILARGSVYDNAYISHAIPRSDDQVHWVRDINGLIQEQLNLEYDENDPIIEKISLILP